MASKPAQIVIGDDVPLSVTLKRNKVTFNIPGTATIKGVVTSMDHKYAYTTVLTAAEGATGADWANSLVVFDISSTETGVMTYTGMALIEVQVDDDGKSTFFAEVEVLQGTIG